MRVISDTLQNHLNQNATTLCHCWKIICQDGTILGFTDHDRNLMFNSLTFQANCGLDSTELEQTIGFATQGGQISGALTSDVISEQDLVNGKYDKATVEIWLVNWADTTQCLLIDIGMIGEVLRTEYAFKAEVRSLGYLLDQEQGHYFQPLCDAELGDARCQVALSNFTVSATVTSVQDNILINSPLTDFDTGWFTNGIITFTSGFNNGLSYRIKSHGFDGVQSVLTMWTSATHTVVVGDSFNISAGCSKTYTTCQQKFSNLLNFRGFPHMPGNDRVFMYPSSQDDNLDGSSLNI